MDELLNHEGPVVVVLSGPGGVGKTALATRWAHDVSHRFEYGQLFIDLRGADESTPADPSDVLGTFLEALGIAPSQIPLTLAQRAALYRSTTAGRALLIVADNAFSAAQTRVLIPASRSSAIVVTSRSRLVGLVPDGAALIEVEPLPPDDSMAFLRDTLGAHRVDREHDHAESLARLCGGLPIALTVAAARLIARPQLSLRRMASELAEEAGRLAGLSTVEGSSVQAAFDISYNALEPRAAALYRMLALHPGREFGAGPVASLILAMKDDAQAVSKNDPVEVLLEASLLTEIAEDRFAFHDLLRLHARQRAEVDETPHNRDLALQAMLEWYLAAAARADLVITPYRRRLPWHVTVELPRLPAFESRETALSWLEQERVNLVAVGRAAEEHRYFELAWHLSDVMWPLLLYRKHYSDRLEIDTRGVSAAEAWGNIWAKADMLKRLGRTLATRGDFAAAEERTLAAIDSYRAVDDARGVLDAREVLASIYRDSGRDLDAVKILFRTLEANRTAGERRQIGLTLISLGILLPRLDRAREAIPLLREAQALFAEVSDTDPYNEVRALGGLAAAQFSAGDMSSAATSATQVAERMRSLGSDSERAEALCILGQIAIANGETGEACRHYQMAVEIFDRLRSLRADAVRARLAEAREILAG